jgi:hypothetical protein
MVTIVFPMNNKYIIDTFNTDNDIDVYLKEHLIFKITPTQVVVPSYDNLWVEMNTVKYQNPRPYNTRPANVDAYVDQIQKYIKGGRLPVVGGSVTHDYHYIDPRTPESLGTNIVRYRKMVLGYNQLPAMESYGLFAQYIGKRVTAYDISIPTRDEYGYLKHEKVYNNGLEKYFPTVTPVQSIKRMLNPVQGKWIRDNSVTLSGDHRTTFIRSHDVIHNTDSRIILDNVHNGRKVKGSTVDLLKDGKGEAQHINISTIYLYSPKFQYGYIPYAALLYSQGTGKLLITILTSKYDPITGRVTGESTDYSKGGQKLTYVWDPRWDSPVQIKSVDTSGRPWIATVKMDRNDTRYTAVTEVDHKKAITTDGRYDLATKTWHEHQIKWENNQTLETSNRTLSFLGRLTLGRTYSRTAFLAIMCLFITMKGLKLRDGNRWSGTDKAFWSLFMAIIDGPKVS